MVDDVCLAPLGAMRAGAAGTLCHASIEQQVIQLVPPNLLKCLVCKGLDRLQVRQFKGKYCEAVGSAVELELIVGLFCSLRVTRAEDEPIRLRLGQQLFHELKSLDSVSVNLHFSQCIAAIVPRAQDTRTRPEEAPVATTVFAARVDIFLNLNVDANTKIQWFSESSVLLCDLQSIYRNGRMELTSD